LEKEICVKPVSGSPHFSTKIAIPPTVHLIGIKTHVEDDEILGVGFIFWQPYGTSFLKVEVTHQQNASDEKYKLRRAKRLVEITGTKQFWKKY